jgi:hypothetical protein
MNTLDKIKGRCKIDDITGCWLWTGAMSGGRFPRIYAPKYGKNGAKCTTQTGARAVWQAKTGKAIPPGFRVFHKGCTNDACVNPAHLDCGPTAAWGKQLQRTGAWADQPTRILANQAIGRARSAASIEIAREICASSDTGLALAARYGISRSVVSKIRRGQLRSITAVINPFAGLMK